MTITYQYRHLGKPNPVHRATEPATAPIGQETPETAAPSRRERIARIIAEQLGEAFDRLPDEHFEPSFCQQDFYRAADEVLETLGEGK